MTLSVGRAQDDVGFHTRVLGMRFIKKTVLYDGSTPVYHLYYSNADGDPSSVVTTFPWAQHGSYGKRGTNQAHEVLLSVPEESLDYWHKRLQGAIDEDGDRAAFQVGVDKFGNHVEVIGNRTDDQGTWFYGAGTYHHFAWNLGSLENQQQVKFDIEGTGYTDISELKDRTYFKSVYCRMPGGALFELAVAHADRGRDCGESPEELGRDVMLPPQFEDQRSEIMSRLEPISVQG